MKRRYNPELNENNNFRNEFYARYEKDAEIRRYFALKVINDPDPYYANQEKKWYREAVKRLRGNRRIVPLPG